jgi:hypothetical protein
MMLGGTPRFKNIWDLVMFDIGEKNRFIYGNEFVKAYREAGLLKYFTTIPNGWKVINDPTGLILHPYLKEIPEERSFSEVPGEYDMTGQPKQEAKVLQMRLAAPEPVALILNNYLSAGLRGQKWYELYRDAIDPLRKLAVLGPFHLWFTMNNTMSLAQGGAMSQMIGNLMVGDVGKATSNLAEVAKNTPALNLFIKQLMAGKTLHEATLKGTDDPVMAQTVRDWIDTGGNVPKPDQLEPMIKSSGKALWQGLVHLGQVKWFKAIGDVAEATVRPIMTYTVPWAKAGGFMALNEALKAKLDTKYENIEMTPDNIKTKADELRNGQFDINKQLDNLYGQMNYDSLMLNKVIKDMLFFVIKFPGWNIGSARWIKSMVGGGINMATLKPTDEYEQIALRKGLGMVFNTMLYSNLLYWYINGTPATSQFDLITEGVWTGGFTRTGKKEYIRPATYWRDLWGMIPIDQNLSLDLRKPIETIQAKGADIWRIPSEIFGNKEAYTNKQIFSGNLTDFPKEMGIYAGKQFLPYMARQLSEGTSDWGKYGQFGGWTKTPERLTDTPAWKIIREYQKANSRSLVTLEDQAKMETKRDLMKPIYEDHDPQQFMQGLKQARAAGQITSKTYDLMEENAKEVFKDPQFGPMRNKVKYLPLETSLKLFKVATPDERHAIYKIVKDKWENADRDIQKQLMPLKREIFQGATQ